jgi:hypothetical protein
MKPILVSALKHDPFQACLCRCKVRLRWNHRNAGSLLAHNYKREVKRRVTHSIRQQKGRANNEQAYRIRAISEFPGSITL